MPDRARRPPRLFRSLGGRAPLLFLSHVLPQTERIVCGTGVICLLQYHPTVTAGHVALFDHLANGRLYGKAEISGKLLDADSEPQEAQAASPSWKEHRI